MAATVPQAGDRLGGRFRLVRPIGRGGMAAVWLAEDEQLERPVAIKLLADVFASDPDYAARFVREARTAASVSHPNLVDIFDFDTVEGRPYLVMEYVKGGTLAGLAERGEAIDARGVATDLLRALAKIHAAGIIHRDVKPENVLVGNRGEMRLTDFGIARAGDATRLTRTGEVVGTIRYLAPELREGAAATVQSDLYSLGILLRETFPEAPRDVFQLARRLSEPDPADRPRSAIEALADLDESAPIVALPAGSAPRKRGEPASDPVRLAPAPVRSPEAVLAGMETGPSRHVTLSPVRVLAGILILAAVIAAIALIASGGGGQSKGDAGGLLAPGGAAPAEAPADERGGDAGGKRAGGREAGKRAQERDGATAGGDVPPAQPDQDGPVLELGGSAQP